MNNELTPKQQRFCEEYMVDLNATQAAIRAGYSKKTAKEQGCQNLTKLNIQEEIKELRAKLSERTQITTDKIINELAKLGFSNMQDYVTWSSDGVNILDSENLTEEQAACVLEVSESTTKDGGSIKFKLHDKKGALELLGRHIGIFIDRIKQEVEIKTMTQEQRDKEIERLSKLRDEEKSL